ncbi:hypothetical protein Tco_0801961 [Tanacetum coccineum]|uniref:Uncharacterized protein n=1 Tax=Tanacetum coccineum TaxID=301880 RepID=A0ABQ4ZXN4_9ASTR
MDKPKQTENSDLRTKRVSKTMVPRMLTNKKRMRNGRRSCDRIEIPGAITSEEYPSRLEGVSKTLVPRMLTNKKRMRNGRRSCNRIEIPSVVTSEEYPSRTERWVLESVACPGFDVDWAGTD